MSASVGYSHFGAWKILLTLSCFHLLDAGLQELCTDELQGKQFRRQLLSYGRLSVNVKRNKYPDQIPAGMSA